jgi:hypothetical protein
VIIAIGEYEGGSVALNGNQAVRLARALRALRESKWPERELTQTVHGGRF